MPMKVVPFEETADGRWEGKFGRHAVTISRRVGSTYWRGPEKEVILESDRESFSYSVHGQHSGGAHTLPGAMERAERDCLNLADPHSLNETPPQYRMNADQRDAEEQAHRAALIETIEVDRIAHSRGWETAIDVLPDLKTFAEQQGLYPFAPVDTETPSPAC